MAGTTKLEPSTINWARRIVAIGLCCALTLFLSLAIAVLAANVVREGYLVQWRMLPALPATVTGLEMDDSETLYAVLDNGDLATTHFSATTRLEGQLPPFIKTSSDPCSPSLAAFSRLSNAPRDIVLCTWRQYYHMDCGTQYVYVVTSDNQVWRWANRTCALGILGVALLAFLISGVALLVVSLLLTFFLLRKFEKRQTESPIVD